LAVIGAAIVGGILLILVLSFCYAIIKAISHHYTPKGEKIRRQCGCLPGIPRTLPPIDEEALRRQTMMPITKPPSNWAAEMQHRMAKTHQNTVNYQAHAERGQQRYRAQTQIRQSAQPQAAIAPGGMEDVPLVTPIAGYPTPMPQKQSNSMLLSPNPNAQRERQSQAPYSPSMYSQSTGPNFTPPQDAVELPMQTPVSARSVSPACSMRYGIS